MSIGSAASRIGPSVAQAIRIHVELEENQILAVLEDRLTRNESMSLGAQFEQVSAMGPTRPHPRTPAIPGVLALATPMARRVDRIRDVLRVR